MDEDTEEGKIPCEEVLLGEKRGRLAFNRGAIFRHPITFAKSLGPLLTAHHPYCSEYEGHVFSFRGRRWCIGCFFNSLSFFMALGLLTVAWLVLPLAINRFYLFWGGAAFILVSFVMSGLGLTENKSLKVLSKLILGASFACVGWAVLLAEGFESHIEIKVTVILSLYLFIVFIMAIRRVTEIEKVCSECEYKMRWSRCPGFKEILCPLVEKGFLQPEEPKSNAEKSGQKASN
jgi:hypothetical protein